MEYIGRVGRRKGNDEMRGLHLKNNIQKRFTGLGIVFYYVLTYHDI